MINEPLLAVLAGPDLKIRPHISMLLCFAVFKGRNGTSPDCLRFQKGPKILERFFFLIQRGFCLQFHIVRMHSEGFACHTFVFSPKTIIENQIWFDPRRLCIKVTDYKSVKS